MKNMLKGIYKKLSYILLILFMCLIGHAGFVLPDHALAVYDFPTLPEITDFRVYPSNIDAGSSATLYWDVKNAQSVNIDHGVMEVSAKGQIQVAPAYATTYKVTASNSTGIRIRYITLSVSVAGASTNDVVNYDPVTGRNASVDLSWEQLCLSKQYQVQIARDPGFTLKMWDSGVMEPGEVTSPAFIYPPGNLEAGHIYYWRVRTRQAATGQYILSPWSEAKSFTVRPGFNVRADYYGVQAIIPANGCMGCPVSPVSFSWSGYPGTTKYRFILAKDSQLQNIVIEDFSSTTAYALKNAFEYDTSYYWQVMAVEPVPSDASSVFTFHTQSAPPAVKQQSTASSSDIPVWALVVMVAGMLLTAIVILLAIKARRKV